ncbi:MAG TPA: hypothetical protein VF829_03690 [Candidatus Paceibacterota bacterium]
MAHHAYVIEGEREAAVARAVEFLAREHGLAVEANPDLIIRQHGLFSVEDARALGALAMLAPVTGDTKAIVLAMDRVYHEAQNALLKLLEEPPAGTIIILAVPQLAMLLPTVRSRVLPLPGAQVRVREISEEAQAFLDATKEKRAALIKKLATGKDEDARRANRDAAIRIMDGVEQAAYAAYGAEKERAKREALRALLSDIEILRGYLYDRSAPVRMILEHLSLVLPKL